MEGAGRRLQKPQIGVHRLKKCWLEEWQVHAMLCPKLHHLTKPGVSDQLGGSMLAYLGMHYCCHAHVRLDTKQPGKSA